MQVWSNALNGCFVVDIINAKISGGAMGWQCAPNNGQAMSLQNPSDGTIALEGAMLLMEKSSS